MELSSASMKQKRVAQLQRGVIAAARVIDNLMRDDLGEPEFNAEGEYAKSSPYRAALVTLTYREGVEWEAKHLSACLTHYRNWFKRNAKGVTFRYTWAAELQERGAVHYHMVMWVPQGVMPPFPDKQGWWPHGSSNAQFATSPVGYIAKYASKMESKAAGYFPKNLRLWGYGGVAMADRAQVAFALAPRWLKGLVHHESHPVRTVVEVVDKLKFGMTKVSKIAAWTVKNGFSAGWIFFSPYEYAGFTGEGISLRHRGAVEVWEPNGDTFFIPHRGT